MEITIDGTETGYRVEGFAGANVGDGLEGGPVFVHGDEQITVNLDGNERKLSIAGLVDILTATYQEG